MHLAQWCSPALAVWVDGWVHDWMKGQPAAPVLNSTKEFLKELESVPQNHGTEPVSTPEEKEEKPKNTCNNIVNTPQNEQTELPLAAVEIDDKTLRQLIPLGMDNP